jgi:hypothetical protein
MAATQRTSIKPNDGSVYTHTWTLTTADPTGDAVNLPSHADVTVQFDDGDTGGAWGGATAVFEGSLDAIKYETLRDPQGNSMSTSADLLKSVGENCLLVRPRLSTVGAGASILVTAMFRLSNPLRT